MFCSQFDTHLAPILWTSTHWTPAAKVICLHESNARVVHTCCHCHQKQGKERKRSLHSNPRYGSYGYQLTSKQFT